SDLIQEDLSGISAIKIYRQEPTEQEAFSKLSNSYRDAALALARTRSTLFPLLEGISSLSLLVLLGIGSTQLAAGSLSLGGLVALFLYVERLVFPTALLGFTLSTFQTGQVSLERVEELLQREPMIQDPSEPEPLQAVSNPGAIVAKDLRIRYPDSPDSALDGVSFALKPGELVAVVGPVGCGKTTLARALGRMVEVESGQLWIDGQDITNLKLQDLRTKISLVPQEGYLFTATLAENLRFGNPNASDQELHAAARQAQLEADVQAFPAGYNTLVGERGITLSGGQRQRTALARALLVEAPILVLDDALASVDNRTAAAILQSLTLNQQRSVLFISHQLSAAAACDRVLVLDQGRVVQQGHHRELVQQSGTYRRLWDREQASQQLEAA
ncbi:MAG: ABC transporter ATP-binding protein, partial [Synechococcus sp.]|nr:ABC transporter ATP-binding protein [Synechococcus sp.]